MPFPGNLGACNGTRVLDSTKRMKRGDGLSLNEVQPATPTARDDVLSPPIVPQNLYLGGTAIQLKQAKEEIYVYEKYLHKTRKGPTSNFEYEDGNENDDETEKKKEQNDSWTDAGIRKTIRKLNRMICVEMLIYVAFVILSAYFWVSTWNEGTCVCVCIRPFLKTYYSLLVLEMRCFCIRARTIFRLHHGLIHNPSLFVSLFPVCRGVRKRRLLLSRNWAQRRFRAKGVFGAGCAYVGQEL